MRARWIVAIAVGASACAHVARVPERRPSSPAAATERVLEVARSLVGARRIEVNGRTFRDDCSGFVRAVYSAADVDLFAVPDPPPHANGVRLIHAWIARHGVNYFRLLPKPGDVVFFDNTYDRNHDGRLDDTLTHVGIVDRVLPDGTFFVIHHVGSGVVREPMNLVHPDERRDAAGREINGWLRRRTAHDRPGTPRLMGQLFAGFGTVHRPPGLARPRFDESFVPAPDDDDDLPPPPLPGVNVR